MDITFQDHLPKDIDNDVCYKVLDMFRGISHTPEEIGKYIIKQVKKSESDPENYKNDKEYDLDYFMELFNFADVPIFDAIYHFCLKIFVGGESQNVERIFTVFARYYSKENPIE